MENKYLIDFLSNSHIDFSNEQIEKIEKLISLTLEKNEVMNLTSIVDEDEFLIKMILDSLLPLSITFFDDKKVIDVGTGGGFPGLPLAILSKGDFTLIDSTGKKIEHIKEVAKELEINIHAISCRAEDYAKEHREEFDIATARAVAPLNILLEIIVPLLKVGGLFIALKGPTAGKEISICKKALKLLESEIVGTYKFELPNNSGERNIIVIKKLSKTKKTYPRDYSSIKSKPL